MPLPSEASRSRMSGSVHFLGKSRKRQGMHKQDWASKLILAKHYAVLKQQDLLPCIPDFEDHDKACFISTFPKETVTSRRTAQWQCSGTHMLLCTPWQHPLSQQYLWYISASWLDPEVSRLTQFFPEFAPWIEVCPFQVKPVYHPQQCIQAGHL